MDHAIIPPFSSEWIFWNTITLIFILFAVLIPRNKDQKIKNNCAVFFATLLIIEFVLIQGYYIYQGLWSPQDSLPFHLCRLMSMTSIIVLYTRNQIAFELLLFVGMIGGFHSLLTPELTHGSDIVLLIDYFLVHGGLIAIPLFCVFVLGMRPRKMAWLKVFVSLQILVVSVAVIDFLLGANYMYLAIKPNVDNPFLVGDWPYYIIGLELATLLHAYLVYLPFYFKKSFLVS